MPDIASIAEAPVYDPDENSLMAELQEALARNPMTPSDVAAPAPTDPILVEIDFRRDRGKCVMSIDARALHRYLDALGVPYDDNYDRYADPPASGTHRWVRTDTGELSPMALLRRPVSGATRIEYNLMEAYSVPPTAAVLTSIGDSVEGVIDRIVSHYRPIEISVRIHSKGAK